MNPAGVSSVPVRRRRVLLVTRNFPPTIGGIEHYLMQLVRQVSQEFDVALCGPSDCARFAPAVIEVSESRLTPLPLFLANSFAKGLLLARRFKPDLVLAGSGLMAPHALMAGQLCGARTGVFVYGLDLVVASAIYQTLWLPAIRACDGVIPISRRTRDMAREKGVAARSLQAIVHPGITPVEPDWNAGTAFREQHGLVDRTLLLSVGRLVERKGLVEFVERSLPAIVDARPSTTLVVIGREASDSLNGGSGNIRTRALAAAGSRGLEAHLLMLGQVPDATLRGAWNAADVHVFPGREVRGDMEGFGMV